MCLPDIQEQCFRIFRIMSVLLSDVKRVFDTESCKARKVVVPGSVTTKGTIMIQSMWA